MSQNRSSAVMQQRHEAHDSLDDFPTPPWATRALFKHVLARYAAEMVWCVHKDTMLPPKWNSGWEPCCNRGYMAKVMNEYFGDFVYATDIFNYGYDRMHAREDFLMAKTRLPFDPAWVIANPPFELADQFITRALQVATEGVAMFVRTSFLEGSRRYENIFSKTPPTIVAQFAERVILHKGVLRDPSKYYWNPVATDPATKKKTGAWVKPSTATSYCWVVWIKEAKPQPFVWIPPCRKALERPGDYPDLPDSFVSKPQNPPGSEISLLDNPRES